ncbi:MAG TPA: efflux RND transporter periplasmic adaptor subunit [Xanthobacteraceae bacterium]|jgi:RND family efflux transporter MFP subunit
MNKRTFLLGGVAIVAAAGIVAATRGGLWSGGAEAQAPRTNGPRAVPIEAAAAVKKAVPVQTQVLGTVTPIASVAVKPRVDSEITEVHFRDGAMVRKGDLLFSLDSRTLEAQAKQIEGVLAGAKANLAQAELDLTRYTDLVAKSATTIVTLQNARTQVNIWRASVDSNTAQLENLRIQIDYCTIRAPITGRASMAAVKVGNIVHQADAAPLATIIQIAPVYVTFALSQDYLPQLRQALANETATVEAVIPGDPRRAAGRVTMIENTVDAPTGTVPVRATMPNADELLWPGTLVNVAMTFRQEEAVTVPSEAVQVSQNGSYVFLVKDGVANVQPVTVARIVGSESVISAGLQGGETVVTNGQLLLSSGTKVEIRDAKAGT